MEPPIVLAAKAAAAVDRLQRLFVAKLQQNLRADRARIAALADELELDPMTLRIDFVAIDEQRALLIGDHDVERTAIEEIGERDRSPVVQIVRSDRFGRVDESIVTLIDEHARALVSR